MPPQPQAKTRMTSEEYLTFERNSEIRHEYFDGEIFAMVGASKNHILISANITAELVTKFAAGNSTCRVLPNDMRVKIPNDSGYAYPDIAITCGDIEFERNGFDTLLNPVVIIEILSKSTEAFDRGDKFAYYRLIPSLQEYILISQKKYRIERFLRKDAGTWSMFLYENMTQKMTIESADCEVSLSAVYRWIEFEDDTGRVSQFR